MENHIVKNPVLLYTEQTPNPETLKFVTNKMLYANKTADFQDASSAKEWSALASALFESFPFVKGVYICNNFVTVTKEFNYSWEDIMLPLKSFIKTYVEESKPIVSEGYEEAKASEEKEKTADYGEDTEIVQKIIELIQTYVKPAVEMDGGNIEFKDYKEGVVHVVLQGSCSGCPSSTVTLQSGIKGMLQRMVPQVKDVVSIMG